MEPETQSAGNGSGGLVKTIIWLVVLVLVVGGFILYGSKGEKKEVVKEPIKIGFIGPLTGDLANIGSNTRAAVEIGVEEINAAGGIGGRTLEVVYEDSQCTPAKSSSAINKLISVDKVVAILGDTCSSATLAISPIAEQAKVPLISYASTAAKVTDAGDFIFRTVPSDIFQSSFAAKYAFEKLGKKKAAIVYVNNDWGVGLEKGFNDAFKLAGGEVVFSEGYDSTSKDLRSLMSKVKSSKADILYFLAMPGPAEIGIKQVRELGLTLSILGADPLEDITVWNNAGKSGEGVMFTTIGTNPSEEFKTKMKVKVSSDEIIYSGPYAYDGLKILSQVIGEVGTDGTMIKDALYRASYVGGASSPKIEFDVNGDPKEANYIIKVVKDGKPEVQQ